MQSKYAYSPTVCSAPSPWLRRRLPTSPSIATVILELAFASRIATLGDRGENLEHLWTRAIR